MNSTLTDASAHVPEPAARRPSRSRVFVAMPNVDAPSQEEVAARAFALFEQRGRADGHDLEDWLEAERQLLTERTRA
jgi:hypothetical protein